MPPFDYTSGDPNHLVGGQPAAMVDIRGPFGDIKTFLNSGVLDPIANLKAPLAVLSQTQVGEVGDFNQQRAGRQLTAADFTNIGLSAPAGLWNLSDLTDVSGNARTLSNKGSVPFGVGINGVASTAAAFAGSTAQALYISDTGAADPFRIKTGSWGCWLRTAKRATAQRVITKLSAAAGNYAWGMTITGSNTLNPQVSLDGTNLIDAIGISDVGDDRWHFAVGTYDGTQTRLYVDGAIEASSAAAGAIFAGNGPANIGGFGADGGAAAQTPFYGRVDEAFVTADVLSADQIRLLYCAKMTHAFGAVPGTARVNVTRRRRGAALATTSFPSTPLRLHNFVGGALADQGTNAVTLGGVSVVPILSAGPDGALNSAYTYGTVAGQHYQATDAGLPSGTTARSYGCWLKTTSVAGTSIMGWGTTATADARFVVSPGLLLCASGADNITGPYVADGVWHHAVAVEDNAAGDGVRRKLYLDGRLVGGSTVLNSITLAGANRFRIGANPDGTAPFVGQIDGVFVHNVALTSDQVRALYNVSSQALAPSPKNAGDHVETLEATQVLAAFDTLDSNALIDLSVAS